MKEKYEILAHEYVVSLFPVFMLSHGMGEGFVKRIGKSCAVFSKIENNSATWYILPSKWDIAHNEFVSRIKKDPHFLRNALVQMEVLGKQQVKNTSAFKKNLSEKSNAWILGQYSSYIKSNIEVYSYGLLLPLLDYQRGTFLTDELNAILKRHKAQKYFEILTTPLRDTFNKQQELNLLKIYSQVNPKKIKQHTKKYAWVHYVYQGPAANEEYFVDILNDFARRKINPKKELKDHIELKKQICLQQKKIISSLKLDKYEKQIIELARDSIFYKAYRRELQSWSYYHMEFLLREIGKRVGLSLHQVRMMLPGEIEDALIDKKIDVDVINERMQLVIYMSKNAKPFLLSSAKARVWFEKNVKKEKRITRVNKFKGTVAYKGKAKGIVKIVNSPTDMEKMQQGDILVSHATNPNIMPAMRIASAIVTDEGGLTCHAAIVSREFKIPCVVGTSIAVEVLKDGDKVDVDANHGIVKKI